MVDSVCVPFLPLAHVSSRTCFVGFRVVLPLFPPMESCFLFRCFLKCFMLFVFVFSVFTVRLFAACCVVVFVV